MTPLTITIPHQLGRAEARRRIEGGFAQMLHQIPGISGGSTRSWDGDRLSFGITAVGQSVSGVVDVGENAVTIEVLLPGLLGTIALALKGRLKEAGKLLLTKK
ncbi:polyhydroxyalkanoic acid system family protein [Aquincola sp. MAHUQ-54]|uniref:Polyhydroxyalkanoic acid system family protein n=1 Tax=Aquincola agrisoli TaxID=3119538 RepID=A0AAW9Q0M6_9BURK